VLQHFFGLVAKTPERVTSPEVFGWAHGIGLSGREPSSITIGARLACLSSFYRFLIRMGLMQRNPCEAIERPKTVASPPRGMSADAIKQLLAVIPDTPSGLRDRAIILTLTFTGRRRAEVMNLKAKDVVRDGSQVFYTYRGKGGKTGKRELPMPAYEAIVSALAAWDKDLAMMRPDESLWPSGGAGRGLSSGTFYGHLRRYLRKAGLPLAGVHIFRHSAAKLRRDVGESIRGRESLSRPQLAGRDDNLSAPVGGAGRPELGARGDGDWPMKPVGSSRFSYPPPKPAVTHRTRSTRVSF